MAPAPGRWLGAQTADSDCGWLKQLRRMFHGRDAFVLAETNPFRTGFAAAVLLSVLF